MNILQFVHIICPKVIFSICRRVTTSRFFDAYRRRFSCVDRVRFRHDVSLLCRRIGDVFHTSIVSVSFTTYRFYVGVYATFFIPRSCPFPSRRIAFMSAYRRRFSYPDRVRFRHDVSLLCRRIGAGFHTPIVSVSVATYRFYVGV